MTTTDWAAITALVVVIGGQLVNIIVALKAKTAVEQVHTVVNNQSTAKDTLIAHLQSNILDKDKQIANQVQIAAVLASGVKK